MSIVDQKSKTNHGVIDPHRFVDVIRDHSLSYRDNGQHVCKSFHSIQPRTNSIELIH
jgi:hypothetical protein